MKKTYVKEITYRPVTNVSNAYKEYCVPICYENDYLVFTFKKPFLSIEEAKDLTDIIVR